MIVKNEEVMLGRCLESVRHIADEVIVVDTGSIDRTVEIAESFDARIFFYPWDGSFSNARNYALQQATMDWILIMDADDEFEKQDTDMLRHMISDDTLATAYYCKTLSFLGDAPDPANMLCNLNIYLFRNHMDYRFTGDIHEQLYCSNPSVKSVTAISDIRIYHYGYLNSTIRTQDKRERNLAIVQKELEKHPGNPFMLYNLGNEYTALLKNKEAYDCYKESYSHFDPLNGYSSKLMLRLVTCCEMLGKTEEELQFIDEGLRIYPGFTDLEFMRGNMWLRLERYFAAIRSFEKCLEMGEPELLLNNIDGVGTYKPAFMLFQIHHNLGDPQGAVRYARKALKYMSKNRRLCSQMAAMLMESIPPEAAAKKIMRLLPSGPDKFLLLSDAFYTQHRYEAAIKFARRAEKRGCDKNLARYNQGVCLFYLKRYSEAYKHFKCLCGSLFESRAAFFSRLCELFDSNVIANMPRGDDIYFCVLERFEALIAGKNNAPLASDEELSKPYAEAICRLLEVLMKTGHFDEFDKARALLNLVTDDTVLMRLGKLYFHNGYLKLAYRELERSIRLTGKTDSEALRMMKYILDSKTLES
jgi:glycosyltransferase involved in cell wall biosynthesis